MSGRSGFESRRLGHSRGAQPAADTAIDSAKAAEYAAVAKAKIATLRSDITAVDATIEKSAARTTNCAASTR